MGRTAPSLLTVLPLPRQVNSDKIYWQRNLDGTFAQIYSEKKAVGHFISTKAVGSDERADITKLYKHSEGTAEFTTRSGPAQGILLGFVPLKVCPCGTSCPPGRSW